MSMFLAPERRAAFDAFFTGDDAVIENCYADSVGAGDPETDAWLGEGFLEQIRQDRAKLQMLDDDRNAKPRWAEHFCMAYPLSRDKVKVLQAAEAGELAKADLLAQGFQRLGLLDRELRLTDKGRFKLISALPMTEQVRRLPVVYEEVTASKKAGASTESYVAAKYEEQGFECFEDEGCAIAVLRSYSLLNELPTLRALATDKFAVDSPVVSNLAEMFTHAEETPAGSKRISPDRIDRFCEILAQTTPQRLEAGRHVSVECCRQLGQPLSRWHSNHEKLVRFFESLGVERFVRLCRLELENLEAWGGWPDITAFRGGELVLVEVKQKDKLMFHQARTLARLATLVPHTITSVRVARISIG